MTIYLKHKWHYFNETDDLCKYEMNDELHFQTACFRNIFEACRHTELKSQVTCVKCLETLNEIEGEIRK